MKPLQFGTFGVRVMELQQNLEKIGYGDFIPTGFFGVKTRQAVQSFQRDNGFPINGVFDQREENKMQFMLSNLNREKIFIAARSFLGVDASPNDLAPDELGCADSVSAVLFKALGKNCGIDYAVATAILDRELATSKDWMLVQIPQRGDVLVSPTGKGNGHLSNGHTGIWGDGGVIMSNDSNSGKFQENYTAASWKDRYVNVGGFPMRTYRKL